MFSEKSIFGACLGLLLFSGCSLFLPAGNVPESLVDPPGAVRTKDSENDEVMITALKMFFINHGFLGRTVTLSCKQIDPGFKDKLQRSGIKVSEKTVCYDYQMRIEKGALFLFDPAGKQVFMKKIGKDDKK